MVSPGQSAEGTITSRLADSAPTIKDTALPDWVAEEVVEVHAEKKAVLLFFPACFAVLMVWVMLKTADLTLLLLIHSREIPRKGARLKEPPKENTVLNPS